ncbi:MAG: hypothetical protein A2X70_05805 [Alphaproteobacteria bacterium GWC2_42_16]|nr:MAG: hypothetical protein A2X70_05805 [Alphaproteobacteria bacterium GWC2_42_16]OFW73583.1 MAG: hypothetical protein A2Z80_07105 [Alphaproteobacteria bacterium GWA2_41_27]OFW82432.1 MAG: hypothetical protein A3E50_04505 [Alphaproteobacteria bacterium RIFCSPHIGHO2_12_FULL_42_100]OFW86256.1 MAG: hypothetical protein A2W06_01435 [Alphaproteobacteria bacterium RBG_16_42_14]OFW91816.1 MAG: hypothetical protein A3C41_01475 [Alphaproteobacteria bacterium RIFCSPHIGHO2_02_FULL_42_30]OFW92037.1 MAG: 
MQRTQQKPKEFFFKNFLPIGWVFLVRRRPSGSFSKPFQWKKKMLSINYPLPTLDQFLKRKLYVLYDLSFKA